MSIRSILLALTIFLLAWTAIAQTPPPPPATPPEQLSALNTIAGTWTATAQSTRPNAAASAPTKVTIVRDLKDRYFRMDGVFVLGPSARPVAVRGYYSYDRFQNVYRLALLDDQSGLLDVYEGMLRNNAITFTNLRSGTFFGKDRIFGAVRMSNLAADGFDVELDGSNDEGRTWKTTARIHFERVK